MPVTAQVVIQQLDVFGDAGGELIRRELKFPDDGRYHGSGLDGRCIIGRGHCRFPLHIFQIFRPLADTGFQFLVGFLFKTDGFFDEGLVELGNGRVHLCLFFS